MNLDMKKALIYSQVAGITALALYNVYYFLYKEPESEYYQSQKKSLSKEQVIQMLFKKLKQELKQNFSYQIPRDEKDQLPTKEFFIQMHVLIYHYQKYGSELIMDVNSQERIQKLKQAEEIKESEDEISTQRSDQISLLMKEYDKILRGEQEDIDRFTLDLQDLIFDYFNLIVKEYYMTLEKWSQDPEYVRRIKEEKEKIDKQLQEEEMSEEIPQGLNKQIAEQLLTEKEQLLSNVYSQVSKLKMEYGESQNVDLNQSIMLNKQMFDDKMFLKTGFTGKDLSRALVKHGIYDEKMKEAKLIEEQRSQQIIEAFKKYREELQAKKVQEQQNE